MDAISMLLLTIPVFLPVLVSLDINLIWFGIIYIKMAEIGGMTPPFGISVYVVKGVVGDEIPLTTIFRGIWWFVITEFVIVAILIAFPQISLWLPMTMKRG
jgi:TRAP-type C4-dicarboxylate transport system permease large subunit